MHLTDKKWNVCKPTQNYITFTKVGQTRWKEISLHYVQAFC